MFANEKKIDKLFSYWLLTSLILVLFIIIIGGLTRLTNSGLSITEWELFRGILPPLSDVTWSQYFNEYKKIPQYKLLNFNMSLEEFKNYILLGILTQNHCKNYWFIFFVTSCLFLFI